ncbi:MAG TPA: RETICULATA-related protein [Bdellovibrionota bacterium]|nr:RETICULATA-related protein [Bdellovibrionota bacterium]
MIVSPSAQASEGSVFMDAVGSLVGRYAAGTGAGSEFTRGVVEDIQRSLGVSVDHSESLAHLLRRMSPEEIEAIQNLDSVRLFRENVATMEGRLRSAGLMGESLSASARARLTDMAAELFPKRADFLAARAPEGSYASTAEAFLSGSSAEAGASATADAAKVFNRDELLRLLKTRGVGAKEMLPHLRAATSAGLVSDEAVVRFMKLDGMPVVGAAMRFAPGLRNRILADPSFFMKLIAEEAIGVTTTVAGYYTSDPDHFWNKADLMTVDVVSVMFVDFALVYFLTPQLAHQLRPTSARTGWLNQGRDYLQSLPQNVFEANPSAGPGYSLGQRAASFFYKGGQFAVVGGAAGLVGTALTHGLYYVEGRDQGSLPSVPVSGEQWSEFLFISSNPRYQMLAGAEKWVIEPLLGRRPVLMMLATVGIRWGNSYLGSLHWMHFAGRVSSGTPHTAQAAAATPAESGVGTASAGVCLGGAPETQPGSVGCQVHVLGPHCSDEELQGQFMGDGIPVGAACVAP